MCHSVSFSCINCGGMQVERAALHEQLSLSEAALDEGKPDASGSSADQVAELQHQLDDAHQEIRALNAAAVFPLMPLLCLYQLQPYENVDRCCMPSA